VASKGAQAWQISQKVREVPSYAEEFSAVYPRSGVTMKNLARALAAFERSLVSFDSAFDRHEAGDAAAMSESATRGRELFFGRAKCSTCHSGPNFTDGQFHNTGVLSNDQGRAAFDRVGEFQMRPYPFFQMRQAFKTPSLRNVALTAPYQHDGSEETLEKVVRFYNAGGRDPRSYGKALDIKPLGLTDAQIADLVQFLEALTSPVPPDPSQTGRAF
jgi:cytochrome c peroxidase